MTCTLVSAAGRPCLEAIPIPAATNEMGHFKAAFDSVNGTYGGLLRLVTYDAGALSEKNARQVVETGKDYLLALTGDQRTMFKLAQELLDPNEVAGQTIDVLDKHTTVTRRLTLLTVQQTWAYGDGKGSMESVWQHARTFLRVESVLTRDGTNTRREARLFVSSLTEKTLTPAQWLKVVRSHWGVEINHHTLDTAFAEDERPWIGADGNAMLVALVLRRIAYTLLALFRSVSLRSEQKGEICWADLLRSSLVRDHRRHRCASGGHPAEEEHRRLELSRRVPPVQTRKTAQCYGLEGEAERMAGALLAAVTLSWTACDPEGAADLPEEAQGTATSALERGEPAMADSSSSASASVSGSHPHVRLERGRVFPRCTTRAHEFFLLPERSHVATLDSRHSNRGCRLSTRGSAPR